MATARIVLDAKKSNQRLNGTFPLKLRIEHAGKHLPLNLKIYAEEKNWNGTVLKKPHPNFKQDNTKLLDYYLKAETVIQDYEEEIQYWTCEQLRDFIKDTIWENKRTKTKVNANNAPETIKSVPLIEYAEDLIERYENMGSRAKRNTARKQWRPALNSFKKHMTPKADFKISQITVFMLEQWENKLYNDNVKDTSVNAYMRGLRRIINLAIKENKLNREENYPFGLDGYRIGSPRKTKKRALQMEDVRKILCCELEVGSIKWHCQNQAVLLFNTDGMNFIDLAYLRMNQIVGDFERIRYIRSKTKGSFDVPIAPRSKEILKYYCKGKKKGSDELVMPIMTEELLKSGNAKREQVHYDNQIDLLNKNLTRIAESLEIETGGNITTYVLRHSFATGLKRSGIQTARIQEKLGHSSEKITQIYLDSFDTKEQDDVTLSIAM